MNVLRAAIVLLFVIPNSNPNANGEQRGTNRGGDPSLAASPVTLPQKDASQSVAGKTDTEEHKNDPQSVRILSMPEKGTVDWLIFAANIALVLAGFGGIWVACCTLRKIERQTSATETQAEHMVESERPFLMIEVSGNAACVEFRIRNKGRSPAKLMFIDRFITETFIPISERLPLPPNYGTQYENILSGIADPVNAEWIAPEGHTHIGSYRAKDSLAMIPDMERHIRSSSHLLWIYGSVLYKGLFSNKLYESRYCYRLGNGSWHMLGPYGYNEYK
jgi:hypothetical protein